MDSAHPIISVVVIAYNHEKYIEQTLNGILDQKINVPFEVVVGEDASTDGTRSIIKRYCTTNSNIILLDSSVNKGMQKNFIDTISACKGKYIALCEGDDYWLGDDKLQTQFDFLESNSDYAAVAHNSYKLYDNWNSPWAINQAKKRGEDVEKLSGYVGTCSAGHKEGDIGFDYFLFEKWPFHTASFFFRNIGIDKFPEVLKITATPDKVLFTTVLKYGKIFFEDKIRAVYRVHEGGVTNQSSNSSVKVPYHLNKIETVRSFYEISPPSEHEKIKGVIAEQYLQVAIYEKGRKRVSNLYKAIKLRPSFLVKKIRIVTSIVFRTVFKR